MRKMPFLFMLPIVFFFLCPICQSGQGPKIFIKEKDFDFKETVEGQRIEHVFHFQNLGNQPLEVQKVRPG